MSGQFFISRGYPAELLEPVETSLHQITGLIAMPVTPASCFSVTARRNNHLRLLRFDPLHQCIRVIALVGNYCLRAGRLLKQRWRLRDVGLFCAREGETDRVAEGVDDAMDFCAKSAARATQSLLAVFFWAPAACWWARIAVLSSITSSKSGSLLMAWKTRSQTPLLAQREKRVKVVCQLPSSEGKSRQGAPVRPIHKTASMNRRLSLAVAPGSDALPGNRSLIRSHWSSRSNCLAMPPTPLVSWRHSLQSIVNRA